MATVELATAVHLVMETVGTGRGFGAVSCFGRWHIRSERLPVPELIRRGDQGKSRSTRSSSLMGTTSIDWEPNHALSGARPIRTMLWPRSVPG
jgi:hypothetical protein